MPGAGVRRGVRRGRTGSTPNSRRAVAAELARGTGEAPVSSRRPGGAGSSSDAIPAQGRGRGGHRVSLRLAGREPLLGMLDNPEALIHDPDAVVAASEMGSHVPVPHAPESVSDSARKQKFDDCTGLITTHTLGDPGTGRVASRLTKKALARAVTAMVEARRAMDPAGTTAANQLQRISNCFETPLPKHQVHQMLSDSIVQLSALAGIRELTISSYADFIIPICFFFKNNILNSFNIIIIFFSSIFS
jgi:hypothetical protein